MTPSELKKIVLCGETSKVQFKQDFSSSKQIAAEMVAFANSSGGIIIFGVQDKLGKITGLDYQAIQAISATLGNVATDLISPTIYITTETVEIDEKILLVAHISEGSNKPYKDSSGFIWVKQAADKRRITENSEILKLFQESGTFHPESAAIPSTSLKDIEITYLNDFFQEVYGKTKEEFGIPIDALLQSIGVEAKSGELTQTGLLFFGKHPQNFLKTFMIKAVAFYGNNIGETEYRDSRDICGTIPWMFKEAMAFLKANLPHKQAGQSFNSVGKIEIPDVVLEELLQNALVHADLLENSSLKLLVFSDRIEIINPGSLYGGLSVEDIKLGVSKQRNPLIASFCSKTMIYRGLGSGIVRALRADSKIDLESNASINQFKATIWIADTKPKLKNVNEDKTDTKPTLKEYEMLILDYLSSQGTAKAKDIAKHINLSIPQTKTYLYRLVNSGKIIPSGTIKNRTYSVK